MGRRGEDRMIAAAASELEKNRRGIHSGYALFHGHCSSLVPRSVVVTLLYVILSTNPVCDLSSNIYNLMIYHEKTGQDSARGWPTCFTCHTCDEILEATCEYFS